MLQAPRDVPEVDPDTRGQENPIPRRKKMDTSGFEKLRDSLAGVIFLLMSDSNFLTSLAYFVTSAERVLRDDERDKTS